MTKGPRVLLVDDNPAAIEPLNVRLRGLGYDTAVLHDGAQAMASARRDRPALAIVDVMLPEVNGYQVCRELKRLERPPIVVILTARSEPADRFWAMECGADLFVTKPVDPEALVASVAELLGAR